MVRYRPNEDTPHPDWVCAVGAGGLSLVWLGVLGWVGVWLAYWVWGPHWRVPPWVFWLAMVLAPILLPWHWWQVKGELAHQCRRYRADRSLER